jgi:hypothetical protein
MKTAIRSSTGGVGALLSIWLACSTPPADGEDLPVAAAGSPTDAGTLLEQLDAPSFSQRQEASRKLSEAGKAVFPQLEQAAESGSREVAIRAIEILKRHFVGGDDQSKQAAQAALQRLGKSSNPSAAQRATEALNPQPGQGIPVGAINPAMLPALQQAQIQLRLGAALPAPGVRRVTIRTINGKREIEQQEGEKITKVKDGAAGGIEAEITEKVNGKETSRKIEAKDLDDLKKKDAGAAQVYERYASRLAAPRVDRADTVKRQIESLDRTLEQLKAQLPNNPTVQRSIDSLERIRKTYADRLQPAEPATPAKPLQANPTESKPAGTPAPDRTP